jgi:hypothetical protein
MRRIGGWAVERMVLRVAGICALLSAYPAIRPSAQAQETSLTIYGDGRVLVRRSLPVAVARGTSTIAADLGMRDVQPASIVALDEGVQVRGARVFAGVGLESSLRRLVGQEVLFRTGPDSAPSYVRGVLLSVDPPTVRVGGHVMYGFPGTPVFPDSLVQVNPRYDLTIEAARAVNPLRLLYLSNGISWSASYAVVLPRGGRGQAGVTGMAQIDNGASLTLGGVQVQLLAGVVRRAQQPRPVMAMARQNANMEMLQADEGPTDESVGGTRVYTLPGTVDFAPGESRVIALFQRASAASEPELVLRAQGYGFMNQWPDIQRDIHPEVGYRIRRPATTPFGSTPIPAGIVRVFEPDSAGRAQLVGEVNVDHTPAGRDLRLTTGTAFDVTAQRTQTAFEQRGQRESISAYRVELQNAKTEAVTVLVTDMCPGRCEVLSSTVPAEQGSVNTVGFRVTVPAGGSATLDYRIRARW